MADVATGRLQVVDPIRMKKILDRGLAREIMIKKAAMDTSDVIIEGFADEIIEVDIPVDIVIHQE